MRLVFAFWLVLTVCQAFGQAEVQAASYIAIEAESGIVLFEKAADEHRYPASTTKIMTALTVLERCKDLDAEIEVPADFVPVGESSLHLEPCERVSVRDLLYAVMLRSANDASQLIAMHFAGSELTFARWMNKRARKLGALRTRFVNPHGLHHEDHYTTARDLALIAREAMRHPVFREMVATRKYRIRRSINQEDLWMINRNKLLGPGSIVDGIKTGYTAKSGHCFVGTARRGDFRVITVVLNSPDWKADTLALIDRCYASFDRLCVLPSRHVAGRALVRGGKAATVEALTEREAYAVVSRFSEATPSLQVELREVPAPVVFGQNIGELRVIADGKVVDTVPLVAAQPVEAIKLSSTAGWSGLALLCAVSAAAAWRLLRGSPGA